MRFKKLKIFTAIALVVFILVVANIIVFGLWNNNNQANLATAIDRKNSSITQITSNQTSSNQNSQSSQNSASSTTQAVTAPTTPAPVITHSATRTRAS